MVEKTSKPVCFAIMPFRVRDEDLPKYLDDANHWSEVYEGLIVPAVKKAGMTPQRDDDDYTTRLVGEGIWRKIESADIILCDMSSHNPNVHLELGWALRADKKIVLLKDDVTSFNFDLNQYYTYQYQSRLQPTKLKESISDLSKVIESTLADDAANYSMVAKLSLATRAETAENEGNLEVGMLREVLSEVRAFRRETSSSEWSDRDRPRVFLKINHHSELADALVGTTWRKANGLEDIFFLSATEFAYSSVGLQGWRTNEYKVSPTGKLLLHWDDGFTAECRFDAGFSQIAESNTHEPPWQLVAAKPYIHPAFTGLDS